MCMRVFTQGRPVGAERPTWASLSAGGSKRVKHGNEPKVNPVRRGSSFPSYPVSIRPHLIVHFHPAVVIVEIIYHYSGREKKLVSTDENDEGNAQGLLQLVGWRNASLHHVGLMCLNERTQTEMHRVHSRPNCRLSLLLFFLCWFSQLYQRHELLRKQQKRNRFDWGNTRGFVWKISINALKNGVRGDLWGLVRGH